MTPPNKWGTAKLSTEPARTDLTDREVAKILGSLIGGLCTMADERTVRNAVRWWSESDEAWQAMSAFKPTGLPIR